jgi:predicted outer membrane protein
MRGSLFTLFGMLSAVAFDMSGPAQLESQDFVTQAAQLGRYELNAANLARELGSPSTRALATSLRLERLRAAEKLGQIAEREGLTVPTDLDFGSKAALARLESLSGLAFDREYAEQRARAHRQAVQLFEHESESDDQALASFALDSLPALRSQLQDAARLAN